MLLHCCCARSEHRDKFATPAWLIILGLQKTSRGLRVQPGCGAGGHRYACFLVSWLPFASVQLTITTSSSPTEALRVELRCRKEEDELADIDIENSDKKTMAKLVNQVGLHSKST